MTDTGIGMSGEQLAVIFEPFQQAASSTTRTCGGSGLGLPIAKRLAEFMGGDIAARSELGKGSTFRVSLLV